MDNFKSNFNREKYIEMVNALAKPGDDIVAELRPENAHLLHMAVGLVGEALELRKGFSNGDMKNVREELGDLEFYLQGLYNGLGLYPVEPVTFTSVIPIQTEKAILVLIDQLEPVVDMFKKAAIYNKDLPARLTTVRSKLDQVRVALDRIYYALDINPYEILAENVAKLSERYSGGKYSDKDAVERADKK